MATLATPLPASANVQYYSILFQGYPTASSNPYVGDNILLYGAGTRVGWNQIDATGPLLSSPAGTYGDPYGPDPTNYFSYLYDPLTPNRAIVGQGDSGSPDFIVTGVKGQMYLAGGHFLLYPDTYGNLYGGVDSFTSLSLPQLDSDMGKTGFLPYVVTPVTARWTASSSGSWSSSGNWFDRRRARRHDLQWIGQRRRLGPLRRRGNLATHRQPGRPPDRHLHHLRGRGGRQRLHALRHQRPDHRRSRRHQPG